MSRRTSWLMVAALYGVTFLVSSVVGITVLNIINPQAAQQIIQKICEILGLQAWLAAF